MEPMVGDLTISALIIIVTSLIWIVWDVIAYVKKWRTISNVIIKFGFYSPPFVFACGFIAGHWFW